MARVRLNKRGEIILTLSQFEARMAGDALGETIHRHSLHAKGVSATVMRAIDRGIKRAAARTEKQGGADRG